MLPPVRVRASGRPAPSQARWILLVRPPRERPRPGLRVPLFGPRRAFTDSIAFVEQMNLPDLDVEGEEGNELGPGVLPQLDDRWILPAPGFLELPEPLRRCVFTGCGVYGLEGFGDLVPVLAGRVTEAVAQEVDASRNNTPVPLADPSNAVSGPLTCTGPLGRRVSAAPRTQGRHRGLRRSSARYHTADPRTGIGVLFICTPGEPRRSEKSCEARRSPPPRAGP